MENPTLKYPNRDQAGNVNEGGRLGGWDLQSSEERVPTQGLQFLIFSFQISANYSKDEQIFFF